MKCYVRLMLSCFFSRNSRGVRQTKGRTWKRDECCAMIQECWSSKIATVMIWLFGSRMLLIWLFSKIILEIVIRIRHLLLVFFFFFFLLQISHHCYFVFLANIRNLLLISDCYFVFLLLVQECSLLLWTCDSRMMPWWAHFLQML